ncbi:DUF805 domain-containing protein [Tropicibacter sp. Alg240-R139]|uniref:DUF805 domain-containing protein n=1 Tax=Tropicibacter sp. Alg240-R139 TaxID=2305991 RepID=UPI0013E08D9C|nr:DUF805 domain-containing protein [Tropicibacter sp. Alg240-R139]
MSFAEAVKACFSKYVAFSGRAARPEYWWFLLFVVVGSVLLSVIDRVLFGVNPETLEQSRMLTGIFQLATVLPLFAAGWRRMHDVGYPGWYLLLPMLVSISTMVFLLSGVMAFSVMEGHVQDPEALRGPAAALGLTGLMIAGTIQFALSILMIWWLTRASQPEANQYGDPA